MRGSMPSAQPISPSTTMVPIPSPPPPIGKPKPPPPKPPPDSPRRSSILSLCSDSSKRIAALHRPVFLRRQGVTQGLQWSSQQGRLQQGGHGVVVTTSSLQQGVAKRALRQLC